MQSKLIDIRKLKNNTGQIDGLPKNPRILKDEKYKKLVTSIKEDPEMLELREVIAYDNGNELIVIAGNMRLKACNEVGIKEVPTKILPKETTIQKLKRYTIKDNVSFGEWDNTDLANEWNQEELEEWGLDVQFETVEPEAEEDDFEVDEGIQTDIVLGDLFEIGPHRLLCGDSCNIDDVNKLMNGENAELLFTSPPYSDMREYNGGKDLSVGNIKEFITTFFPFCEYQAINLGIQRKGNDIVQYWDEYIKEAKDIGLLFLAWNVWHKTGVSIGQQSSFIPIYHEWIFVFGKKFKDINKTWDRKKEISKRTTRNRRQADGSMKVSSVGLQEEKKEMESVFKSNAELGSIRKEHPATFPIELPEEYITAITNQGDIVVEPFCGSGSTMVASHQLKRNCYGMELDPKYVQTIVNRMIKLDSTLEIKRNGVPYEKLDITTK